MSPDINKYVNNVNEHDKAHINSESRDGDWQIAIYQRANIYGWIIGRLFEIVIAT